MAPLAKNVICWLRNKIACYFKQDPIQRISPLVLSLWNLLLKVKSGKLPRPDSFSLYLNFQLHAKPLLVYHLGINFNLQPFYKSLDDREPQT